MASGYIILYRHKYPVRRDQANIWVRVDCGLVSFDFFFEEEIIFKLIVKCV